MSLKCCILLFCLLSSVFSLNLTRKAKNNEEKVKNLISQLPKMKDQISDYTKIKIDQTFISVYEQNAVPWQYIIKLNLQPTILQALSMNRFLIMKYCIEKTLIELEKENQVPGFVSNNNSPPQLFGSISGESSSSEIILSYNNIIYRGKFIFINTGSIGATSDIDISIDFNVIKYTYNDNIQDTVSNISNKKHKEEIKSNELIKINELILNSIYRFIKYTKLKQSSGDFLDLNFYVNVINDYRVNELLNVYTKKDYFYRLIIVNRFLLLTILKTKFQKLQEHKLFVNLIGRQIKVLDNIINNYEKIINLDNRMKRCFNLASNNIDSPKLLDRLFIPINSKQKMLIMLQKIKDNMVTLKNPYYSQCSLLGINYFSSEGYINIIDIIEIKLLQYENNNQLNNKNINKGINTNLLKTPLNDEKVVTNNILQNFVYLLEHSADDDDNDKNLYKYLYRIMYKIYHYYKENSCYSNVIQIVNNIKGIRFEEYDKNSINLLKNFINKNYSVITIIEQLLFCFFETVI